MKICANNSRLVWAKQMEEGALKNHAPCLDVDDNVLHGIAKEPQPRCTRNKRLVPARVFVTVFTFGLCRSSARPPLSTEDGCGASSLATHVSGSRVGR
jgi:hypothetical protein